MKTKSVNTLSAAVAAVVFAVLAGAQWAAAQETLWIPVTFYDFRSNRSNPEFEQPHDGGKKTGMVASVLDADNKPTLGPTPMRNYGIQHWFRDWNTYTAGPYSKGKNIAPKYEPTTAIGTGATQNWDTENKANVRLLDEFADVGHDTSFKNIVIKDSLPFRLRSGSTDIYEFDRQGNDEGGGNGFFYIDNRGFGNESRSHNYSFTMELAFEFQAKKGMSFNFRGDDDVWVFIDKNLVLDIGGIHSAVADNFSLDKVLAESEMGKTHILRVFYAERHTNGSNILIQTNILAPPTGVGISTVGNTSNNVVSGSTFDKPADSTRTLYSVVYDDNNNPMDTSKYNCNNVTWTINGVVVGKGCSIQVKDSVANASGVKIEVTYRDPDAGDLKGATTMNVKALPPVSIHIQRDEEPKPSTTAPNKRSDDIYFGPSDKEVTVYAVLRDKYGNFAGYAVSKSGSVNDWTASSNAQWKSDDEAVAKISTQNGKSALVVKQFEGIGDKGSLIVTYTVYPPGCNNSASCAIILSDTVNVGSKSEGQIAIGPNPFVNGPSGKSIGQAYEKSPKVLEFYKDAIEKSIGGTAGKGVLIAVDAPNPIDGDGGKDKRFGRVNIYDAVGNLVRTDALYASNGARSSYGYVWDGKNAHGRFVGPGTYLVRVSGTAKGETFKYQRMVGVKK